MTDEEKLRKSEERAALEKQQYEEAVALMLEKKAELGRMPTERELKKDSTVNVGKLVKALGKRSFSEAVIEVLRYVRVKEGRPKTLTPLSRPQMDKLKELDPNEYAKQLELRKERELKQQRVQARIIQDRKNRWKTAEAVEEAAQVVEEEIVQETEEAKQVTEVVEVIQTTEEVAKMLEGKTDRRGVKYTYEEIWEFAKEHNLAELTERGIRELGEELGQAPAFKTLGRLLGPKKFWAEQLACETAEEGEKARKRLEKREQRRLEREQAVVSEVEDPVESVASGEVSVGQEEKNETSAKQEEAEKNEALVDPKDSGVLAVQESVDLVDQAGSKAVEPKVMTVQKLTEMLGGGGAIDQMLHICSSLSATWDVVVYIGDTPVEITLKVDKAR